MRFTFKEDEYIRKVIFDDDLNFTTETKIFQNWQSISSKDIINLKMINNTFILSNANVYYDAFNQTSFQTSIHKFNLDFQSDTWETFNKIADKKYSLSFGEDLTTTTLISTDLNATFAYIKSRFVKINLLQVQYWCNNCKYLIAFRLDIRYFKTRK